MAFQDMSIAFKHYISIYEFCIQPLTTPPETDTERALVPSLRKVSSKERSGISETNG